MSRDAVYGMGSLPHFSSVVDGLHLLPGMLLEQVPAVGSVFDPILPLQMKRVRDCGGAVYVASAYASAPQQ